MNGANGAGRGNGAEQAIDGLQAESARKDEVIKALTSDLQTKERTIRALELQLALITNGPGWKLLGMIWPIRRRLIPPYSRREQILQLSVQAIAVLSQEGVRVFLHKTVAALRQSRHAEEHYVQNPNLPSLVLADGAACPQPPISVVIMLNSRKGQAEPQSVMEWVASQTLSEVEVATWDRATGHASTSGARTAENVTDVRALCEWLRGRYVCFASADLLQQRATYLEENLAALASEILAFTVNVRGKAEWSNDYFKLGRLPGTDQMPGLRQVVRNDCLSASGQIDLTSWSNQAAHGEIIAGKVVIQTTNKCDLEKDLPFDSALMGGFEVRSIDNYLLVRPRGTLASNQTNARQIYAVDTVLSALPKPVMQQTVLVVMPFLAVGGAERVVLDMMRGLCTEVRFVVFAPEKHDPALGTTADAFRQITPYVYTSADFLSGVLNMSFLRYLIGHYAVHTLYIANGVGWVYDRLEELRASQANLRIVNQVYDHQAGWIARYDAPLVANVDVHIGVNQKICTAYIKHGARKEQVQLIEHCVDLGEFDAKRYTSELSQVIRGMLGLPPSGKIVTFIGRIHPQKRPMDFVELARRFADDPSVYFLMVGDGMLAQTVDIEAARIGLRNFLRRPFYDPSRDIYAVSDVIVLPSEYEGMPVVVLEAQAMGKPVVVTDVGNTREVLELTHGGVVVDNVGDIGALRGAVIAMLGNPPDPRAMREVVASHFGPAGMAAKFRSALLGDDDA